MELACIVSSNLPFLFSSLCNLHHVEFSSFQISSLLLYLGQREGSVAATSL